MMMMMMMRPYFENTSIWHLKWNPYESPSDSGLGNLKIWYLLGGAWGCVLSGTLIIVTLRFLNTSWSKIHEHNLIHARAFLTSTSQSRVQRVPKSVVMHHTALVPSSRNHVLCDCCFRSYSCSLFASNSWCIMLAIQEHFILVHFETPVAREVTSL